MCLLGGEWIVDPSRVVKRSAAGFAITPCYHHRMGIRTALAALLCLSASTVRADDYKCREADAGQKLNVTFGPTVSLHDLSVWILGFTCKNVVFSPDVAKHATKLTIMAPKPMTPKQALQLFVDAVQATGLVVEQKPDTIVIKLGPNMPKSCPDLAVAPSKPVTVTPPDPTPADPTDADVQLAIDSIKKVDDTHYTVPASVIDLVTANPMAIAKGARVVPSVKDGKDEGLKLYAVRPSSVFAKLGLTNGDTVVSVNGLPLSPADKALEAYSKVRSAKKLDVSIIRRGKPVTLVWTIK